jgi:anti-sigma-K factor RskA
MSESDDIDALAGEYVLGTLDAAERAEVAARRLREPLLDQAISFWEGRLAALDAATQEVAPNPATWSGILARLDARAGAEQDTFIIDLTRRLERWRAAALLSGVIAASFALGFIWRETASRGPDGNFVAVLQRDAASPAFIVDVDLRSRVMTVRPVAAQHEPGKSYELWLIHDSLGTPKSLGVVADQGFTVRPALANYDRAVVENGIYAVTLEPVGGSPDGKPSGPPLWTGKLMQATP